MATANDIIKAALRLLKVKEAGEALTADEAADGLVALNDILESWSNERWMQTHITEITHTLTADDGVYTVSTSGSSGDMQLPETLYCGRLDLADQDVDEWTSITSGHFQINIKGAGITSVVTDFSTATSMTTVASLLQAAMRSDLSNTNVTCTYDDIQQRFEISTSALPTESISYLTASAPGGTIRVSNGSDAVTGDGTAFTTDLVVGDIITWTDDVSAVKTGTVLTITNDTALNLSASATSTATDVTYNLDGDDISSKMKGLVSQATNSLDSDFWPVRIQSAFIRDSSNNDYPIYPLTDEQYGRIGTKVTTSTYPQSYYYERAYPVAKIHLYDVPSTAQTLHIKVWPQWSSIDDGTDTLSLPPGYERALKYNLAVEISPEYVDAPSPIVIQKAAESKAWIKRVNHRAPIMRSDARHITGRKSGFDVNSGGYR